MTGPATAPRAFEVPMAPEARALSALGRIDYEDSFLIELEDVGARTAEAWGRATIEAAPPHVRAGLVAGWTALGLCHGLPSDPKHVLGWPVRRSDEDVLLLGARSRIGMPAEVLFMRRPAGLFFATFVEQRNGVAKALWSAVEQQHRRTVRGLLDGLGAAEQASDA